MGDVGVQLLRVGVLYPRLASVRVAGVPVGSESHHDFADADAVVDRLASVVGAEQILDLVPLVCPDTLRNAPQNLEAVGPVAHSLRESKGEATLLGIREVWWPKRSADQGGEVDDFEIA